uniref:Rho-GAP domain-containing protein n=1 Tax=Timema tahoe TaxID=61484 RepID=A0A7R9FG76_9NEOP|nr:unnamed protein product [Timema tahoe]
MEKAMQEEDGEKLHAADAVQKTVEKLKIITDRSCRLLALRGLLKKLPVVNFDVLKFVFQHFVKVSENCKLNSMDSKNLAICWWPTLLPIEFNDMGRFEQMRPHLEDLVQTMIDQYPFLFCGKEAFVMALGHASGGEVATWWGTLLWWPGFERMRSGEVGESSLVAGLRAEEKW